MAVTISQVARTKVRRRAEAQMTDSVTVYRGQIGALDPSTGILAALANATQIYSGPGRLHIMSGTGTVALGGGTIAQAQVVISIPMSAPLPYRDDVVTVDVADDADPTEQTRVLRVLEVAGGSLFGDARRLTCTAWAPSRYWAGQQ